MSRSALTSWTSNDYHLRYIRIFTSQRQATVKFYGVFASHWTSMAFTPSERVRRTLCWDSMNLVTPFMRVVIQTTRYFAHVCCFTSLPEVTDQDFFLAPHHFWWVLIIADKVGLYLHHYFSWCRACCLWGFFFLFFWRNLSCWLSAPSTFSLSSFDDSPHDKKIVVQ